MGVWNQQFPSSYIRISRALNFLASRPYGCMYNRNIERIYGSFDHYWENNRFGTLSGKEREEIESTNLTEEVALECFKRENWWSLNNHYESDYIPEWGIMSPTSTPPMFYLFDSIDGETQIVRQLEYIDPRHKSFRESQTHTAGPRSQ